MSQRQLMQLIEDETKFNEVSEEMFKYVNLDSNGYIDFKEFSILMQTISFDLGISIPSKEDIHQIFNKLDINKNGKIKDQMKIFFRDMIQSLMDLEKMEIKNQRVVFRKENLN